MGDGRGDQTGVCQWGEGHEGHPVREFRSQRLDYSHSESGLAHTTGTGQGYETCLIVLQKADDGRHLALPADKAGQWNRPRRNEPIPVGE